MIDLSSEDKRMTDTRKLSTPKSGKLPEHDSFCRLQSAAGFTLAELLIVVAIIGILVAISVPIFTGQREKAIKATNQANIRAAKAAASAEFYIGSLTELMNENNKKWAYLVYNTESGTITTTILTESYAEGNSRGMTAYNETKSNGVCKNILVFVKPQNVGEPLIQTAPYYTEDGELGMPVAGNPYGPRS